MYHNSMGISAEKMVLWRKKSNLMFRHSITTMITKQAAKVNYIQSDSFMGLTRIGDPYCFLQTGHKTKMGFHDEGLKKKYTFFCLHEYTFCQGLPLKTFSVTSQQDHLANHFTCTCTCPSAFSLVRISY